MELSQKIEGLLFYKGEPMTIKSLAELLHATEEEIETAIVKLEESFKNHGLTLIKKDNSIMMAVAQELSSLIEAIRKEEITKDLSKATLETFSIILYKNGATRSEIDFIRGVNSSFILRNLLIRGLVEKEPDPKDSRRMIYHPTYDALSFMGIHSIKELPKYEETRKELEGTLINNIPSSNEEHPEQI
jgi:segregation and condensation protein B